jgi:uncharacterized protein YndB with AHSA1/START domain
MTKQLVVDALAPPIVASQQHLVALSRHRLVASGSQLARGAGAGPGDPPEPPGLEEKARMTDDTPRFLRMTRSFEASPERVFAAWVNPETVRRWLFASPVDESYTAALDVRVGGAWSITARRHGVDYTASGEYLEIDPPRRLVFTFAMLQFSPNSDRITVEIAPSGAGCVLTFTQEGVDIADELRQLPEGAEGGSESGWGWMFEALAAVLG